MEIIIKDNCDHEDFYRILAKSDDIGFNIIEQLNGFDSKYIDIEYEKKILTLHYDIYLGISIYPKELNDVNLY